MRRFALVLSLTLPLSALVSCLPDAGVNLPVDGGVTGAGGRLGGGSGGNPVAEGSGGQTGGGSGGVVGASGGTTGTGGRVGTGGSPGTGGRTSTGGVVGGSGGAVGTGGRAGTGGVVGGSGGAVGTGGRVGTGGAGTGGSGTGGAQATACVLPNHTGSGSFTHYDFGQGTLREGNGYRTACGYFGTEGGTVNLPDPPGTFPTDSVPVIGSIGAANAMYFAAIPGTNGFDTRNSCGACVQITGQNGRSVIATIIDECPYGSDGGNSICAANPNGELDLSTALFGQLGYSVGNPSNTTWKFVACPVTGNVVMQIKTGNNNEIFIQNTPLAIKSVVRDGQTAVHQSYGAWHFGTMLNVGDTLTLTDALNRVLAVQVKSTAMNVNQDAGVQFASCQ